MIGRQLCIRRGKNRGMGGKGDTYPWPSKKEGKFVLAKVEDIPRNPPSPCFCRGDYIGTIALIAVSAYDSAYRSRAYYLL